MTKQELISAMAEKTGATKKLTGELLDSFMGVVTESLAKGDEVRLMGFGTFTTVEKAARKGRNPQTGEEMIIAARKTPKIKFAKALKDTIKAQ